MGAYDSEFSMETEEVLGLSSTIAKKGAEFEQRIAEITKAVDDCSQGWTNGGYPQFKQRTKDAEEELTTLRQYFKQYGTDVENFANDTKTTENAVEKEMED